MLFEQGREATRADPLREPREPCEEDVALGLRKPPAALRRREARPLVFDVETFECVQRLRDLLDRHATAYLAPEVELGAALRLDPATAAKALVPAQRLEHHRREDVEEVVVCDREAAVDLVHPAERAPPELAVPSILGRHSFAPPPFEPEQGGRRAARSGLLSNL